MTAQWASRRLITGIVAIALSPVIAAVFSLSGAQGANPPVPVVSLSVPGTPLIGSSVAFDVSFTNTSPTQTGYGPYVDLRLPLGVDGNDGLTFTSATYLGASLTTVQLVADAGGCVLHPYAVQVSGAPVQICGLAVGQSYVVLRLPFGSFTPGQPAATARVTTQLSNLADAGTALTITANGGFQFGATALNDPATDPSVLGATVSSDVHPSIMTVTKTYVGPEDETATGPNYPRSYTLSVTIAAGQTVGGLVIADTLPNSIQYVSTNATTPASSAVLTPLTTTPGGTLSRNFGSVTGTGGVDATMTFNFYVPRLNSVPAAILNASTGAFNTSTDSVSSNGTWAPIDVRDSPGPVSAGPATHTLNDKSIAVQKSVSLATDTGPAGVSPGDTLQWTISTQVSDYFALNAVVVDDLLGDGTLWDGTFTPTLQVNGNTFVSATANFNAANYTVSAINGADQTPISFRLSNELITRGQNGRLIGGCVRTTGSATPDCTAYNDGATTATIVFRSVVQQAYHNLAHGQVVEGDTLVNQAASTGAVLNTGTFVATGSTIGDGSAGVATAGTSASISIDRGTLTKTIYAINGSTSFGSPVHVSPGDSLTYRLQQTFPTSRTDDFRMTDFLPLPVFYAAGVTTFDAVADSTAPAAGHAKYGPADTFHAQPGAPTPTVSSDITANSVEFLYGNYALYPPALSTADILFTVTVSTDPFADGLLLTNQARSQTKNAVGTIQTADAIVQITLDQPVVAITKGIVGSDNAAAVFSPGTTGPVTFTTPAAPPSATCPSWTGGDVTTAGLTANPIDSNVTGLDAGDYVRFAVTLHNTGHANAWKVRVADTLPAGFVAPAGGIDLCIANGAGTAIGTNSAQPETDLFGAGFQLTDGAAGSLEEGVSAAGTVNATGTNVVVLTYTLQVAGTAEPSTVITNTASLLDYANDPFASSHLGAPLTDDATATTAPPATVKLVTGTDRTHTADPAIAIGEVATYQVTLTIPEGVLPGAVLTDTLDTGLGFVRCTSISASPGLTTTLGADFSSACDAPTNPTVAGQVVTFGLGDVTNANRDNTTPETITITYEAVAQNVAGNTRGKLLSNGAVISWTGGSIAAAEAGQVRVVEPLFVVTKTASSSTGDSGDTIDYTITITNPVNANGADAFDVHLSDVVPAGMTYQGSFTQDAAGTPPAVTLSDAGAPTLTADWVSFPQGSTAVLHFSAKIDNTAEPAQTFTNTADLTYTGLPGTVAGERTGTGVGPNTYFTSGSADVDVPPVTLTKTLIWTNLGADANPNVVIGEFVRFRVVATIPEGRTPSATLVDTLPTNVSNMDLAFLDCESIDAPAAITTSLGEDFSSACMNDASNPALSGRNVTFDLGDIVNSDTDNGTPETITITYRAVVLNTPNNNRGTALVNSAVFHWTGHSSAAAHATLNVIEPRVTVVKSANPTTGDAGDTITYQVTITNDNDANGADAYDVNWTDTIPAGLTYVPGSLTLFSGPTPDTLDDAGAPTLTATWESSLLKNTAAVLRFQATLDPNVPAATVYRNTASITWTSLPGDHSAPGGLYSPVSNERSGNTGDPGGAVNDYTASNYADVTVNSPAPIKTITNTSLGNDTSTNVVVGEVVTYQVALTIPEGTMPSAVLTDTLPAGLALVDCVSITPSSTDLTTSLSGTSDFSGACSPAAFPAGNPTVNGQVVTFDLGTVTNVNTDNNSAETITMVYRTVVVNDANTNRGTLLHNSAVLSWTGHSLAAVSAPDIKVTEPLLTVSKTATPSTGVDAGDEITYRVTITNDNNTNGADAYEVAWSDTIPSGLTYVPGSLTLISGPATTTLVPGAAPILTATWDSSFLKNSTAVIEFKATLDADVEAGRTYHNTASISWTDLPGDVTTAQSTFSTVSTERTGNVLAPGGSNNDYRATSNDATVTVTQAVPAKTITNTSLNNDTSTNVVVGEVITYRVTVTIPEGTMNSATVTDTLPAGLALVDCTTMPSCVTITRSSSDLSTTLNGGVGNGGFDSATTPGAFPDGNPTVNGQVVTFDLGTITNANSDNGTAETLAITYNAVVLNIGTNNRATTLVNSAVLHWSDDIGGSYTPAAVHAPTVTVQEPLLTVAKTATPSTGVDAGDTITYVVTVTSDNNINATTAYDVTLKDIIGAGLTYVPASLQQTGGAGTNPAVVTVTTTTVANDTMNATFVSFAKNSTAVIQFQATLDADVPAGHVYHNTAAIDWTGLPGDVTTAQSTFSDVSTERTGNTLNPGAANNDYRATSNDATVTVTQPAPVKSLVSTSDVVTTTTHVAIGEVARYQIMVTIPEGVTPNVIIRDTLPAGLRYLNDGSATVALVANGGGMTSSTLGGAGLQVVGDGTWAGHPTFAYPTGSVTGGTGGAGAFVAGDDPAFPLGTLTNSDSDAGTEVAVLEFNVIVENVAGNQSSGPTNLADTGAIWSDSSLAWTNSNTITLTVAEPSITFAKTVTTTPVDAGDTIVYHVLVTNAAGVNNSAAYDVRVLDTVSANLGIPVVTVKPGCLYTDNSSGRAVDVTLTEVDPGSNCWVDITTTANALDAAALRISNTATSTWTSLLGTQTGERTGSGGINDYTASSTPADVNLAVPSIAKLGPTSTSLPIGGTTTYDLVVTLPEGTTRSLVVTDVLPAGMAPVGYSVVTSAASSGGRLGSDFNGTVTASPASSPPAGSGGGAWTLTFGDTITAADNVAGNNAFLIRITGRIANIAGNQSTTPPLVNSASLIYTNPQTDSPSAPVAAPQTPTVSIIEPVLQLAKSAGTPNPMYGNVVTYTLTISHTGPSNSPAYDVSLTDTMPAGLTYSAASLQNTAGVVPAGMSESGGVITVTYTSIAVGQTSTITYQASVTDAIPGHVLTNNAAMQWTSLSGADTNERTGNTGDPGGALNDYSTSATSSVTVDGVDMSITKDDGVTSATVGSILQYVLGYHNAGNATADSVVITEHVPTGTTFRSASSTGSWSCADGSVAGTLCTLSVGSVAAGATSSYTFAVRVIDTIPSSLTSIDNTATIAYDPSQNVDPTPGDNTASDSDTIPVADLSATKTVDDLTPNAGQVVAFTITVSNAGPATATDVRLTDALPPSLVYSSNVASQGSYNSGTGVWTVGSINSGESATLTLSATVTTSAVATNVVQVTHSDQTDPDSTPANDVITEDDYATATVTPKLADLAVTKTVDNQHPDVGSDVTFTITAVNNGPSDATGVQVTDALPAGLTYKSDSTATGSYDPVTHIWTIGSLTDGATATLTLVATVAAAGPITNTATIAGNQYDPDPTNNTDDISTDQLLDLAVTKVVDNTTANVGTDVTFTVEVTNLGPSTATTVVMHDMLPAGLTWVSDSASAGTSYDHTTGVWTVGTIAEDAKATLTITATVATSSPVTNTASVTSLDEPQVSTANDSASATVWPPRADLAVDKSVVTARPEQGDPDTFTIRITNLGPDTATNVVITDLLPAGLTFTGYTASTGIYDNATGIWTLGTIVNGTSATLTIHVTVDDAADYTNTATVTHSDQYDPDPANNSDDALLSTRVADIAVTKVPSDATPAVGSTVNFTITATNNGPDNATQLTIHDLLPAGLTYISATPEAGTSYDPITAQWTIGNLANGSTVTMGISARVVGSGIISNTASVSGLLQRDPDHNNDSATAAIDPPPAADLSLTKTVNVPAPDLNTDVTFTIMVTNHGPNAVGGVHVQDILPAELVFVSYVASSGTYDSATGDWDVGGIANGGHQTLTLVATVTVEGPLTNTAQVSASGLPDPDSTPGNSAPGEDDQAAATINSIGVADLSLAKQVKSTSGKVGGQAVFELAVHNAGPDGATHVIVRDQLPSGVTYVSSTGGAYNAVTGAWTVGSMPAGSSATLEITVRIGRTGGITNVGEVAASDQRDPNSIPNDNVPSENDQSQAVLSGTQGTPPPTAASDKTSDETGGIVLLSMGLALAGMCVLALSFLTARNRINRAYRRRS